MSYSLRSLCSAVTAIAVVAGTIAATDRALGQGVMPDDPRFVLQWGLRAIDADLAWNITTGSTHVTVAVLDTGIDYTHPDLYLNIWINQEEIPPQIDAQLIDVDGDGLITFWDLNDPSGINIGPGKITDLNGNGYIDGGDLLRPLAQGGWADGSDNGDNGYVDDLVGWDFLGDDNDPMDVNGHGTHSAGIIGAVGNNGVGVAGINWRTQIMPVRFFPTGNYKDFTFSDLLAAALAAPHAIRYAVDNGARVSNNSWGAPGNLVPPELGEPILEAIDYAESHEHLMVFSGGNEGESNDDNPRAILPQSLGLPNVISVAATMRADRLSYFSSFGATTVHLGAPGHRIWSSIAVGDDPWPPYDFKNGTSMAAPHVAAAAALILSVNPDLSYTEVKALILDNVDSVDHLDGLMVTGGRLNIASAVLAAALE